MFKTIIQLIILVFMLADAVFILFAKYFVSSKKGENKADTEDRLRKLRLIGYSIFAGLAIIIILINLF